MKKQFTIIDLDNTISDDGWRIKRINWDKKCSLERYHNYHEVLMFDAFANKHILETDDNIAIFTARPRLYLRQTEYWLRRNSVNYSHLYMRENDDHRSSVDIKRDMAVKLIVTENISLSNIKVAYDDRQDIVDSYRSIGIPAERVFIHTIPYTQ
jgi:hypothetical protein